MKQYLDLTTWILLFAMAPFTILVLLSQNTGPGDLFYPVKRGMENVILAGASFSPATKVAFRTGLTEQRYKEAEKLLLAQADTGGLIELVDEITAAEQELQGVTSFEDKKELSGNLIAKIDQYQTQLVQVQASVEQRQTIQEQPSQEVTPAPAGGPLQVAPQPTQQPAGQPQPTQTPISPPTSVPGVVTSPTPTAAPVPTGVTTPIDSGKKEKAKEEIEKAKRELEKVKERLKREKEEAELREKIRREQEELKKNLKEQSRSEETNDDHGKGQTSSNE